MDSSFEEWLIKKVDNSCLKHWWKRLVELGVSWDTFRRDSDAVTQDLVSGGIPLIVARDICILASKVVAQSEAPLAIFWDMENMPIPSGTSGKEIAKRLKDVVAPHGNLVQFRAYQDVGLGHVSPEKRSELQLSNCQLIDCPHNGRKEVADKMIIVDAMQFAFTNPDGASICFVTGDVDYAYLLAVLRRPKWKTIVISTGTQLSMLHANGDLNIHWERDVLCLSSLCSSVSSEAGESIVSESQSGAEERSDNGDETVIEASPLPITWTVGDAELLRNVICGAPVESLATEVSEERRFVRKSYVGNALRQTNPVRFADRKDVKAFLAAAISIGFVIETGEGAFKTLSLTDHEAISGNIPSIRLSDKSPVDAEALPPRALEMTSSLPFILFVHWKHSPKEDPIPPRTFVQSSGHLAVMMFPTLASAQRAVAETPWLRHGTLVDWRKTASTRISAPMTDTVAFISCALCKKECRSSLVMPTANGKSHCQPCYDLMESHAKEDKLITAQRVVEMLEMMALNDDKYIAENILRKQLALRWPSSCSSREHASLWIEDAIRAERVTRFKRANVKSKLVCLPNNYELATAPFPEADIDTTAEEQHVLDMLWDRNGWMKRTEAIHSLKSTFETMQSPLMRNKCILNAAEEKKFFFAKDAFGQTLGLSIEDAQMALSVAYPRAERTEDSQIGPPSGAVPRIPLEHPVINEGFPVQLGLEEGATDELATTLGTQREDDSLPSSLASGSIQHSEASVVDQTYDRN